MFGIVKKHIKKYIKELEVLSPEVRINDRIEKFNKMGVWK
jgi:acetyl-CoA carboxylase alpha subunit